jgi:methylamine methyltransferase corrinoid protein reductive activase
MATRLGIALDLGTSGFRAQALDLTGGEVLSTAISTRHPLPGANVIDHLHFALETGVETACQLIRQAINQVIDKLQVSLDAVIRLAVCGNPTQLSLFQGMEIRDLAYAGSSKLQSLGVDPPERHCAVLRAADLPGLRLPGNSDIIIPPAVRDEVGADALALIMLSGLQDSRETAIAIDYGTNAEMALIHQGRIYIGSAAAGPALEGQHISCGSLAMPGAIADLEATGSGHRLWVLNEEMRPQQGGQIDLRDPTRGIQSDALPALTITGTGVIAALDQAICAGIIDLPRIRTADQQLHLGREIFLTEADVTEAGKAIGAIRAGYCTLCLEAGIEPAQIGEAYLAGASGTYVDARKSTRLGLVPPRVKSVRQIGNTSLSMARELVLSQDKLAVMSALADELRQSHCMFALSKTFTRLFLLELSYWTEGMPMATYRKLLNHFELPDLAPSENLPHIERSIDRDIGDLGILGLTTLEQIGQVVSLQPEGCVGCRHCMEACPSDAIFVDKSSSPPTISLTHALCNGVACRRCEPGCEPKVFHLDAFFEPTDDRE